MDHGSGRNFELARPQGRKVPEDDGASSVARGERMAVTVERERHDLGGATVQPRLFIPRFRVP